MLHVAGINPTIIRWTRGLENITDILHDRHKIGGGQDKLLVVEGSANIKKMTLSRSILRRKTFQRPVIVRDGHELVYQPVQLRMSGKCI